MMVLGVDILAPLLTILDFRRWIASQELAMTRWWEAMG
jgi:hypothetical protein